MYRLYADRYRGLGETEMRDAMGRGSANTGGYANSYAMTSGQAAYGAAIGKIGEKAGELEMNAAERYGEETEALAERYRSAQEASESDYNAYRDRMADWQNERSYAASTYDSAYGRDHEQYKQDAAHAMELYEMERADAKDRADQARKQATMLIDAGIMPSAALLRDTGWDAGEVRKLVKKKK